MKDNCWQTQNVILGVKLGVYQQSESRRRIFGTLRAGALVQFLAGDAINGPGTYF